MASATFQIWRGDKRVRRLQGLHHTRYRRHGCARRDSSDSGGAGERSRGALELQSR